MTLILWIAGSVALLVALVALALARLSDGDDLQLSEEGWRAARYRDECDPDLALLRQLGKSEGRR